MNLIWCRASRIIGLYIPITQLPPSRPPGLSCFFSTLAHSAPLPHPTNPRHRIFSFILYHLFSMRFDPCKRTVVRDTCYNAKCWNEHSCPINTQPATRTCPMPQVSGVCPLPDQSFCVFHSHTHSHSAFCTLFHFNFTTSETELASQPGTGKADVEQTAMIGIATDSSGDRTWSMSQLKLCLIFFPPFNMSYKVDSFNHF